MNKSKFLKKSLAMLLAVMLVVAMIPLSASAADTGFTPTSVKPVAGTTTPGTATGSGTAWNIEFNYTEDTPVIDVQLGSASGYTVKVIRSTGTEDTLTVGTGLPVERDADEKAVPFKFYLTEVANSKKSDVYTVNWTVKTAQKDTTVATAKLDGTYNGVIDNSNHTIAFTVPFGYTGDKKVAFTYKGNAGSNITDNTVFAGTVGTNKVKAVADTMVVVAEDGITDQAYKITVAEEAGLTAMQIGTVKGTFEKDSDGLETGTVFFNMPAGTTTLDSDGKLNLVPTITVGSYYTKAELPTGTVIKSGEKFDFAALLGTNSTGQTLTLTNKLGVDTRAYTLVMVPDQTDTAITAFTAVNGGTTGSTIKVDGVVNGTALTAEVPAGVALSDIDLSFTGPKGAAVTIASTTVDDATPDTGIFAFTGVDCTNPVQVKVVAADKNTQKFYTLTVKNAEAPNTDPKISAAKMIVDKDATTEAEYTATISGTAITFTVPYSTTVAQLTAATYLYSKTPLTEAVTSINAEPFTKSNTVKAIADSGVTVPYAIKFVRASAESGKTISDLTVTKAANSNEIDNRTSYKASITADKFKLTIPKTVAEDGSASSDKYNVNFTLSKGAKVFVFADQATATPVAFESSFDATTGALKASSPQEIAMTDLTTSKYYMVVDESVAVAIQETPTLTYEQIKNKYAGHFTAYTFEVTKSERTGDRITAMSADDKAVTGAVSATKVVLSVPYSYATTGKEFFLDYTVSDGAKLTVTGGATVAPISGGLQNWNTATKKLEAAAAAHDTNPNFKVINSGTPAAPVYELHALTSAGTYAKVTALSVTAEKGGTPKAYTVEVKALAAETGATLNSVKVGKTSGSASGKTFNVNMPYGTNLASQTMELTASKFAAVMVKDSVMAAPAAYNADTAYNFTSSVVITVTSEDLNTTNVYTIKAAVASQFSDVKTTDWFYDYVMKAAAEGIIVGKGDGTFAPNANISRRDFAIMTVNMLGVDTSSYTTTPFSDVAANDYAMKAIAYCADKGIIAGSDGKFRPADSITRQEAAVIIAKAKNLTGTSATKFADDAKIGSWAKTSVYACNEAGIISGDKGANTFRPTDNIKRSEAAVVMVKALAK